MQPAETPQKDRPRRGDPVQRIRLLPDGLSQRFIQEGGPGGQNGQRAGEAVDRVQAVGRLQALGRLQVVDRLEAVDRLQVRQRLLELGEERARKNRPNQLKKEPVMIRGRCPTCSRSYEIAALDELRSFPFCSDRCRLIDLGRWIDGKYVVPASNRDEQETVPDEDASEGEEH